MGPFFYRVFPNLSAERFFIRPLRRRFLSDECNLSELLCEALRSLPAGRRACLADKAGQPRRPTSTQRGELGGQSIRTTLRASLRAWQSIRIRKSMDRVVADSSRSRRGIQTATSSQTPPRGVKGVECFVVLR